MEARHHSWKHLKYVVKVLSLIPETVCMMARLMLWNLKYTVPLRPVRWRRCRSHGLLPRSPFISCKIFLRYCFKCPFAFVFGRLLFRDELQQFASQPYNAKQLCLAAPVTIPMASGEIKIKNVSKKYKTFLLCILWTDIKNRSEPHGGERNWSFSTVAGTRPEPCCIINRSWDVKRRFALLSTVTTAFRLIKDWNEGSSQFHWISVKFYSVAWSPKKRCWWLYRYHYRDFVWRQ